MSQLHQLDNDTAHEIIQLPPNHCPYNPTELVWAEWKRHVVQKNKTFTMTVEEKLEHITKKSSGPPASSMHEAYYKNIM
jgi:hypothetical protein